MARALQDIITELNSVYNPQRDTYNTQIGTLDPQREAEQHGLEAAQKDSFQQITQGANRRGLFFSGIPLEEQAKYTGSQFLPAVANLRSRYAQQKFNLQDAIGKINTEQYNKAYGVRQGELQVDEEARQFNEKLAAQARAEEANRVASVAAARSTRGGGGGGSSGGFSPTFGGDSSGGGGSPPVAPARQLSLRQTLQQRAAAGDYNSQVGLQYLGDNGRYDGAVNTQDDYNRLKSIGALGNFYVRGSENTLRAPQGGIQGLSGLNVISARRSSGGGGF